MTVRILIADDHDILRAGIRTVLEADPEFTVLGEADTGREAVEMARTLKPDLVLMDITMPDLDGIAATGAILEESSSTKVLALSMHENRDVLVKMLKAGASGYLLKIGAAREIRAAIRTVLAGRLYLSPSLVDGVVKEFLVDGEPQPVAEPRRTALSPRQKEVLEAIVQGQSLKEIAFHFGLSVKTIEKHRAQLMEKLGAKSSAELTMKAVRQGLVDPWRQQS